MSPPRRTLVIGAGVVGVSLARALARSGRAVVVLSAGRIGETGASAVPVALLNPYRGRSGRAHPDDLAALAVTWRWSAELRREGRDPGATRSGVLRLADGAAQARAFARVPGWRVLATTEVPAPYRGPHGGALADDGGWLAPRPWLRAIAASAVAAGARLEEGARVAALERTAAGTWRATAEDGRSWAGAHLLLATGADPWPAAWAATVGPVPAFARHAGDVVTTSLPAPRLPLAGSAYVGAVDAPDGRMAAVGGHHREPGPPTGDTLGRLAGALGWAWPPLADATATSIWWGVRAHAAGNRPQVRQLTAGAWWVGGLAGRGFLAAAAVAEAVAADLTRSA